MNETLHISKKSIFSLSNCLSKLSTSLIFISILSLNNSSFGQTPVDPELGLLLQKKIDSCKNKYNLPGISVALQLKDNTYWNGVSGKSHIYTNEAMTENHVFFQASVTKLFVSTIIMQLVEENKLSLEDTIGKYLPTILNVPSNIKIKYLVNHRSGLHDFISNPQIGNNWINYPDSIWSHKAAIETFNDDPIYAQGTSYNYSNTNYVLLGWLIETITGNTFDVELTNRIAVPLGITDLYFPYLKQAQGAIATGWTSFTSATSYDTDAGIMINDCSASMIATAGFITTSEKSVLKFTRALFTEQIVNAASIAKLKECINVTFGDGATGYGYGTMRYSFNNKIYFGHGGDFNGFTMLTIHGDNGLTMSIGINRNNAPRGPIAAAILKTVTDYLAHVNLDEVTTSQLTIFPNPATDELNIVANELGNDAVKIQLVDLQGKEIYSEFQNPVNGAIHLNLDSKRFTNGYYVVHICNEQLNLQQRLIIE